MRGASDWIAVWLCITQPRENLAMASCSLLRDEIEQQTADVASLRFASEHFVDLPISPMD